MGVAVRVEIGVVGVCFGVLTGIGVVSSPVLDSVQPNSKLPNSNKMSNVNILFFRFKEYFMSIKKNISLLKKLTKMK
ncbi:MAG TPA: hypothetical protein EYP30_05985 [Archaeoglobaceae archaeon]|nr:hypothetical protein [Archaeoglobaceae archaeon]